MFHAQALPTTGGLIRKPREDIVFKFESFEILRIGRAAATNHGERRGRNFCTYATATVENLNIMGVITADLITNRVTSLYPVDPAECDPDPEMHKALFFLGGSTFHNLKIAGTPFNPQPTRVVTDGFKVGRSAKAPASIFDWTKMLHRCRFGSSAQSISVRLPPIAAKLSLLCCVLNWAAPSKEAARFAPVAPTALAPERKALNRMAPQVQ